jgi:hypothetical protein
MTTPTRTTKKFTIHVNGTTTSGADEVAVVLNDMITRKDPIVSITETKKPSPSGKTLTIEYAAYDSLRHGAAFTGTPTEALSFIQAKSGKKLVQQRVVGAHHAFTEKNIEECFMKMINSIGFDKGAKEDDVYAEFIEFIGTKTGETKKFDTDALTNLLAVVSGVTKTVAKNNTAGRVRLLKSLHLNPSELRNHIERIGYDYDSFVHDAQDHFFIHYAARNVHQLRSGKASEYVEKNKSPAIVFDPSNAHIVTNNNPTTSKKQSAYIMVNGAASTKRTDKEYLSALTFMAAWFKRSEEDTEKLGMTHTAIKDLASSYGWVYVPEQTA